MGLNIVSRKLDNIPTNTPNTPIIQQNLPQVTVNPKPADIEPGVEKLSKPADRDGDLVEIIDPSIVKIGFESNFSRKTASEWIQKGYRNFINLTYFEGNGKPTSNFFSNGVNLGAKLSELGYWPLMTLKPKVEIIKRGKDAISPIEGFSGSSMVVINGQAVSKTLGPKEAAIRQRTGVGITASGDIIVYVTKRADVNSLGRKMQSAGAVEAINVDGGGSSLFVRDGQILFPTSRPIPTILAW
jgi:exopolysaccharide biosynthesis protein